MPEYDFKHPTANATFLQLWHSHLDWTRAQWEQHIVAIKQAGCQRIIIQWAVYEDTPTTSWALSNDHIAMLLDVVADHGMTLTLGTPYHSAWWSIPWSQEPSAVADYMDKTLAMTEVFIDRVSPLCSHPAFSGWYLPFEVDQYSWSNTERRALLASGLQTLLSRLPIMDHYAPVSISTFCSQLAEPEGLVSLWAFLLHACSLRLLIQDGVGGYGLSEYKKLAPLCDMLKSNNMSFDMVVELFHQTFSEGQPSGFQAKAASYERVQNQIQQSIDVGATSIVFFALDPWMLDTTIEGASALHTQWLEQKMQ